MKKLKDRIIYGALGATCGSAGLLTVTRCGGGNCAACFGCAGIGLGVIILMVFKSVFCKKGGDRGLAKGTD